MGFLDHAYPSDSARRLFAYSLVHLIHMEEINIKPHIIMISASVIPTTTVSTPTRIYIL